MCHVENLIIVRSLLVVASIFVKYGFVHAELENVHMTLPSGCIWNGDAKHNKMVYVDGGLRFWFSTVQNIILHVHVE